MSCDGGNPEISTAVAHAFWDEHAFRGYALFADLMGRVPTSGLLVLALTGKRLNDEECAFVDEIVATFTFADPRIWPLKISRIVGAYGRFIPALAVGYLSIEGASIGPGVCTAASRLLSEVFEGVQGRVDDADSVARMARETLARTPRLAGFGVAFRPTDERVAALRRCVQARGRERGPYWRLFEALVPLVRQERRLEPNIGAAAAAALLDMGFEGAVLGALAETFSLPTFLANSIEAATEPAAVLRALPLDRVEFVGRAARESPRAIAKHTGR